MKNRAFGPEQRPPGRHLFGCLARARHVDEDMLDHESFTPRERRYTATTGTTETRSSIGVEVEEALFLDEPVDYHTGRTPETP